MRTLYDEKHGFQRHFVDELLKRGYIERKNKDFDRQFAMDKELLFKFLEDTQADTLKELRKLYKDDFESTLINFINKEVTKKGSSLINVLKHGVELSQRKLSLMYTKPATEFNPELMAKYEKNIFSVMQEVCPSDKERVDLVIFLNGFAIFTFELKSEASGQDYHNAISQYRYERDPKSRLFLWKAGSIVNFAMDTSEVYMTTKLEGEKTFFMPFNMGRGEGIDAGAGNPIHYDKDSVSYIWEDILEKDTVLDLISKFIFIQKKEHVDNFTGKVTLKETVIFPRFHQLDLIRKVLSDVYEFGSKKNYLIEHSAGSGKTNSIAWLAHRLASFHDADDKQIFDTCIIVTDRVIVDRQLQEAVLNLDHQHGLIKVLGDDARSSDLRDALNANTKIIATTIQKFPYVVDELRNLREKTFAVIIDEAHSSTSGKNMQALTRSLASEGDDFVDVSDFITDTLLKSGKQDNVSMFAFTATPKPQTLRMFGRLNAHGQYEAFHLYSMKQAIEEGFILDVLQNFTTYKTLYKINKEIEDDPKLSTKSAKRQIARFIDLHETNITQRVELIIEHFRNNVMDGLGGKAKAMVVTASREAAMKYMQAFSSYIAKKGYKDLNAVVAFSGKVSLDGKEYTEQSVNGIREEDLAKEFDKDSYNVMIVANKYQTGFDQNKLCAMYVMKKLKGVNAVQTLSRLNRVCPPFDKHVFVLDFVNSYEDIKKAFTPYYTTTLLANDLTPSHIYNLYARVQGYYVINPVNVDELNDFLFKRSKNTVTKAEESYVYGIIKTTIAKMKTLSEDEIDDFVSAMRSFKKFYEYLIQVSSFEDEEVHKTFIFVSYLLKYVNRGSAGGGFDLRGMIKASNFVQEKGKSYTTGMNTSTPVVELAVADGIKISEDKLEKLSQIISDINSRLGKDFNVDVAAKAALQIKDIMMKSDELRRKAQNNSEEEFLLPYFSSIDNALIEGLDQNQDFFTLLLNDADLKKQVLGIFAGEIYNSLRN